ncbi:hypothetical protein [Methanolobus bombayensis]|uniref:hypothetical protein n=1 Tax=Methanolobus bombayensis TaxID=38023 RepID=UPI001AE62470|nr:hypothetical protein [Methanolobus bombayensis]MBP1908540.1 hypothetical protein [Methanolobus bombayensis]
MLNDTEVSNDAASGNAFAHVNETEITVENEDTVTLQVKYTSSAESRYIAISNTRIAGNVVMVPVNNDNISAIYYHLNK